VFSENTENTRKEFGEICVSLAYYILREKIMINKSKGVENDFNEDDFFRIMVKAAKIDFE